MRLLPQKFMSVQSMAKDVGDWEALERERAKHAPVLGQDDWYETLKYNFVNFFFCDCISKAFAWVVIASAIMLYLTYQDAHHETWVMGATQTWFIYGNWVASMVHFAAKDEFKKIIAALCSRYSGQPSGTVNGNPATAASKPVIPAAGAPPAAT